MCGLQFYLARLCREVYLPSLLYFFGPGNSKLLSLPYSSVILCEWSGGVSWVPAVADENTLKNATFCMEMVLVRGVTM